MLLNILVFVLIKQLFLADVAYSRIADDPALCTLIPGYGVGGKRQNVGKMSNATQCKETCEEMKILGNKHNINGITVDSKVGVTNCYCEYNMHHSENSSSWFSCKFEKAVTQNVNAFDYGRRSGRATDTHSCGRRTSVPRHLTFVTKYNFYRKYMHAYGLPILSSGAVSDQALTRACNIVRFLFADRRDVRQSIYSRFGRFAVIGRREHTTNIPEFSHLPAWWNQRARGLGGVIGRPMSCGGEENVLCLREDRYFGDSIFFHEAAHNVAEVGLAREGGIPGMYRRIGAAYSAARRAGKLRGVYGNVDQREYWAEGMQSFFENHPGSRTGQPDGTHNHVNTRAELRSFDYTLYRIIKEVYPCMNTFVRCNDNFLKTMRTNCDGSRPITTKSTKSTTLNPNPTKCIWVEQAPVRNTNCRDSNRHCRSWASKGECTKNPSYMKVSCCRSCSGGGGGGGGDCQDNNGGCSGWARAGYCRTNDYTKNNCRKSCNTCSGGKKKVKKCWTITTPATTTTTTTTTTTEIIPDPPTDPPTGRPPIPPTDPPTGRPPIPPTDPPTGRPPIPPTDPPTGKPPIPPTDKPIPPTAKPIPPTDGPIPPTDGPIPPTDGPIPPTDGPKSKCELPIPVGLESKAIADSAMTASSMESNCHRPSQGRLNLNEGVDGVGAWCAAVQDLNQYLQVDLGGTKTVKQVSIQGRDSAYPKYVKKFTIKYSDDGNIWSVYAEVQVENVPDVIPGNSDTTTVKDNTLAKPFSARYVRIVPTEWENMICMRLEIYSC